MDFSLIRIRRFSKKRNKSTAFDDSSSTVDGSPHHAKISEVNSRVDVGGFDEFEGGRRQWIPPPVYRHPDAGEITATPVQKFIPRRPPRIN